MAKENSNDKDKYSTALNILERIKSNNHISVKEIGEKNKMNEKYISRFMRELEDSGIIKKEFNNDKRKRLLFLTPKGEKLLQNLKEIKSSWK
ncbi:MAG: MarR family transcriptional regulator [Candidatus Pacearchaeota archaeon]|jgi:DNA-binding MarR family transcriptional regulator